MRTAKTLIRLGGCTGHFVFVVVVVVVFGFVMRRLNCSFIIWSNMNVKNNNNNTVKILNIRTPKHFAVITLKFVQDGFTEEKFTRWLYRRVMHPKDAVGIANSVDPDQTVPLGAVWSGPWLDCSLIWVCTVCPGIYLSENLGSLG